MMAGVRNFFAGRAGAGGGFSGGDVGCVGACGGFSGGDVGCVGACGGRGGCAGGADPSDSVSEDHDRRRRWQQ